MQFKAVALLAVVSFGTSAVALPGANPQPSSTPAPKPQVPVYDTTGFTGELVADKDKGTCYVKLHLPGIDCDGETDHDDHRLAYEDGSCVGRSKLSLPYFARFHGPFMFPLMHANGCE